PAGAAYRLLSDMRALARWFRRSWITRGEDGDGTAPLEAVAWRCFGVVLLVAAIVATFATHPRPGLHGRDAIVLGAFIWTVAAAIAAHPERQNVGRRQVVLALLGVIVGSGVLGGEQPHGVWIIGPYYVAIVG